MRTVDVIENGIVCSYPDRLFGYYAWPSIARMDDGTLIVVSSGERIGHLCFGGKTTMFISKNDGKTWLGPVIVNDTPLDDRDAGILSLGGSTLLLTWFNLEGKYVPRYAKAKEEMNAQQRAFVDANTMNYSAQLDAAEAGSFCKMSFDGGITWSKAHRIPASAPHGPALLSDGTLLLIGKEFHNKEDEGQILVCMSADKGITWKTITEIPIPEDTKRNNFFEPHAVELPDHRLIGLLRYQHSADSKNYEPFTVFQTESADGGNTWTTAHDIGCCGSPPHVLLHSSRTLVCVYGRRKEPFGESVMLSYDGGNTWDIDLTLFSGAPSPDLGYPASVELADGSIMTVYYQKKKSNEPCSLLFTRWRLPE